jgi:hypothetical protein
MWDGSGCRFELLAAGVSGDLAYSVGYEHTSVSWDGTPLEPYTLRREGDEWKIALPPRRLPEERSAPSRRRIGEQASSATTGMWSAVPFATRRPWSLMVSQCHCDFLRCSQEC